MWNSRTSRLPEHGRLRARLDRVVQDAAVAGTVLVRGVGITLPPVQLTYTYKNTSIIL